MENEAICDLISRLWTVTEIKVLIGEAMKRILRIIFIFMCVHMMCQNVFALTIVSPAEGQVVHQGDRLTVIVRPDAGETWEEVHINIYPMSYNSITRDYREEIIIPMDQTGYIDFSILAYDKTGREIELKRKLFVNLPSNALLYSIVVDNYEVLFKLPSGSATVKKRQLETIQLRVTGKYSDGFDRDLASSASGTTYTSNDEQIVTVNAEGVISAQGIGTAKITVRNGIKSADVKVVVKPY